MSDSLGGFARTLMLVTISPSGWDRIQTLKTLEFAMQTGLINQKIGAIKQVMTY